MEGTAGVSTLLQQMKNGEISKLQMFQQLAKLQAAGANQMSSAPAPLLPPPAPHSIASSLFANNHAPTQPSVSSVYPLPMHQSAENRVPPPSEAPAPYVTFTLNPAPAPVYPVRQPFAATTPAPAPAPMSNPSYQSSYLQPSDAASVRSKTSTGATMVGSDAEFLATGVSHDKAQPFSVQEWIANKMRSNAHASTGVTASSAPMASKLFTTEHNHTEAVRFDSSDSSSHRSGDSYESYALPLDAHGVHGGAMDSNDPARQQNDTPQYVYTPQRNLEAQNYFLPSDGRTLDRPHEYIDFSEPFRDDHGNDLTGNRSGGGNGNGNGGGNGGGNASTNDDAKFHTRVTRWKSQKDAIREQMKQQLLQAELDECTFTPKVNPKSTKVVARMRGRLSSAGDGSDSNLNTAQSVSERLYQEADNYKAREELATRLKADEEAELQRECTFRPRINKGNPITEKVKPKYMDLVNNPGAVSNTTAAMEASAKAMEECTFHPRVNPIGPEMVSAQLYLQQDIYERLSRSCLPPGDNNSNRDMRSEDGDSSISVYSPRSHRRSQDDCYVRSQRRRSQSMSTRKPRQRPRSAGGELTEEDREERARSFQSFLERQQFHEQARRKRIEMTKQHLKPEHRPTINKKSLSMMENGRRGDFLERITKYALRKEHDTVKMKTVRVSDPNCTFKPQINTTSARRKPRSVTELSRGDLLRRETTQRLMKLKMEQEEMAALTFRPQLNRVSDRFEGKLKILTSPDTYLQRIQQQTQAHTVKQRRAVQEKELEEFAECTFKPRTIEAPSYVQRIARSVALTKALKQQQQQSTSKAPEKPDWR
ncbi:TPA: hypothetical protein N0F65_001399 [Lagenidium giganteum]|uniref:Uncharacterized protein n=1 Tax=Lagenidium giganteum TaxID=4803 RepID=A0AAV2YYU9_9STRA|nr:TPA: hypothetical protein N0F65_001399 [Lagenidium giganteum]